jgi:cytochrome c peroxidase
MASSVEEVLGKLRADPKVERQFRDVYGRGPDRDNLLDAIATFERSLITPGSRFDRWLAGDASAITPEELSGYQLFKSFGCVSCHQGVNVGGNLFQRHGIFHPLGSAEPELVRVPSLRNVATTAPYFHDGSAPTLAEAVKEMGVAQLDRLLTREQIDAIVAFLNTLTGTYKGRQVAPGGGPHAAP